MSTVLVITTEDIAALVIIGLLALFFGAVFIWLWWTKPRGGK